MGTEEEGSEQEGVSSLRTFFTCRASVQESAVGLSVRDGVSWRMDGLDSVGQFHGSER